MERAGTGVGTHRTAGLVLRAGMAAGLVAALVALVFPQVTGAEWTGVAEQVGRLSPGQLVLPLLVWVVSLYAYAVVCAAALPGLSVGQAMTMFLAGSAVSNVAPLGAAVGVGASYGMAWTWGFRAGAFALFTLVTGLLNLLVRLILPLVAILLLGPLAGDRLEATAAAAGGLLVLLLAVLAVSLRSAHGVERAAAGAEVVAGQVMRLVGSRSRPHWEAAVLQGRSRVVGLLRARWATLALGMLACTAAQAGLLWLCLRAVGLDPGPGSVLAVFAAERVLSSVTLTPSGVGITETGCVALLVALGAPPEPAAAGVLLFRGFTYLAEIPAGALAGLVWAGRRSWRRAPGSFPPAAPPVAVRGSGAPLASAQAASSKGRTALKL